MRMQITVDEKTKEVVERLARITGVSQSCVFSFGVSCICHEINTSEDMLFEELFNYSESYYKVHNKQGGRNEKTQTLAKKSQNLSDSRWLPPLDDSECTGLCETCTMECK